MPLNESTLKQISFKNQIQTIALLGLMGVFSWLLGSWLFGDDFALIAVAMGVIGLVLNPAISSKMLMRAYRATPLTYQHAPELVQLNEAISKRANLSQPPALYYVPVGTMNAFATGSQNNAVIGLSHGLLQQLTLEEMAGVLSHEISHIRHNDMRVMAIAETLGNLMRTLSLIGQFSLLFSIPMILAGVIDINLIPLALLVFAPTISAIIQLAISRRREFQADASSAELLGTPEPLMKALIRLDNQNSNWERFYRASSDNGLLRTHPKTSERIDQLRELYSDQQTAQKPTIRIESDHKHPWNTPIRPKRISRYFWF